MHEDTKFPDRHLAALVTSKVYYHLGEYNDALVYALAAGDQFDVAEKSEYVDKIITIISKIITIITNQVRGHHDRQVHRLLLPEQEHKE